MKAFVGWPVEFKTDDTLFHVTAKYLGEVPSATDLIFQIKSILKDIPGETNLDLDHAQWCARIFDPNVPVLELANIGKNASMVASCLAILGRPNDYPDWRPHIAVPHAFWDAVREKDLQLQDYLVYTGPLTLFIDKKPYYVF